MDGRSVKKIKNSRNMKNLYNIITVFSTYEIHCKQIYLNKIYFSRGLMFDVQVTCQYK